MKIKKLTIKNYKNLNADLDHNSDLIAFIGNNGSGKSNLLEAICQIFRSLYVPKYKVSFDYNIIYETSNKNDISIRKIGKEFRYSLNGQVKTINDIVSYLPQKVIGIYSGEEKRLYDDVFKPFYEEFVFNINKAQSQGTVYSELPKMLYLNRYYWNISLLCLLLSDATDAKEFIKEKLKISDPDTCVVSFDFIKRNYVNYNDNQAIEFIRLIDRKTKYSIKEFRELVEMIYSVDSIFKYLYLAFTPKDKKIIDGITIELTNGQTLSDFSEGEKKLLLIKGALDFAGQEDSLFILDEPDSHIHINNKEKIYDSLTPYLHNRQIILTTHSPTLTQCISDENVYMLNNGEVENKTRQAIIEEITGEFWNKHEQGSFLASQKPIVLFVEGKHDKEHISNAFKKLKEEYDDLSFDIFNMNSACNIPPMMTGLRTCETEYNKIFIGIFDDDQTGRIELSNTTCKFPDVNNSKRHKEGYFAFKYPKKEGYKSTDYTIENFFEPELMESSYNNALIEYTGKFSGKSIDRISEDVKDLTKTKLFESSKGLTDKEDFKHFRKLFDCIRNIKEYYEENLSSVITLSTNHVDSSIPLNSLINEESRNGKSIDQENETETGIKKSAKENHLAYWNAFNETVKTMNVSFKTQKARPQHWMNITIGSSDFRLAVLANTRDKWIGVQLIFLGENATINFKDFYSNYKFMSLYWINKNVEWKLNEGKKEHHVNLIFPNTDPLDFTLWEVQHTHLAIYAEKFYKFFYDKINRK